MTFDYIDAFVIAAALIFIVWTVEKEVNRG